MKANLIESNPNVMMGKSVVAGTRTTVELIVTSSDQKENHVT